MLFQSEQTIISTIVEKDHTIKYNHTSQAQNIIKNASALPAVVVVVRLSKQRTHPISLRSSSGQWRQQPQNVHAVAVFILISGERLPAASRRLRWRFFPPEHSTIAARGRAQNRTGEGRLQLPAPKEGSIGEQHNTRLEIDRLGPG